MIVGTMETESTPGAGNVWAVILAAGEGTRLRSLTTTAGGLTVPKQFCSLHGGASLLEEAMDRGESVVRPRRITTIVAAQHRSWWEVPLRALPRENIIVQPENKGTAVGLLLPLLHVLRRDPDAVVAVLPADHYVREEDVLAGSIRRALEYARADRRHVYLLGLEPERFDSELGYIVPDREVAPGAAAVRRFVEKPSLALSSELVGHGALWNAFILAASAGALLELYRHRQAGLAGSMAAAVDGDPLSPRVLSAVHHLYRTLPMLDFSKDVMEGQEDRLRVIRVPNCGWNDLGTPQRVAETLNSHRPCHRPAGRRPQPPHLNLAEQHLRQHAV